VCVVTVVCLFSFVAKNKKRIETHAKEHAKTKTKTPITHPEHKHAKAYIGAITGQLELSLTHI
jgi:hypothetical protein